MRIRVRILCATEIILKIEKDTILALADEICALKNQLLEIAADIAVAKRRGCYFKRYCSRATIEQRPSMYAKKQ